MLDHQTWLEKLQRKWCEVPFREDERVLTSDIRQLQDLFGLWTKSFEETVESRGWYRGEYVDRLRGKRVLDFGCGLGYDGVFFAEHGANVTFADIVEDNLLVVKEICLRKNLAADFYHITDLFHFSFSEPFDCVFLQGVIHHSPFELMQKEMAELVKWLKPNGTVLALSYPKERWVREGCLPFDRWGKLTDGDLNPWSEWYDEKKVLELFGSDFALIRSVLFHHEEFVWFELKKL